MCAIQITFLNRVYRESRSVEEMKKKINEKEEEKSSPFELTRKIKPVVLSSSFFLEPAKKTQIARNSAKAHPILTQFRAGQDRDARLIMAWKNAVQTRAMANCYRPGQRFKFSFAISNR